jgi:hypothetical protein
MLKLHEWSQEIWSKNAIFNKYWTSLNPHIGIFIYRFVMVVRKNVLEYIIALVFAKNKVRLKKCLKKIPIWQSSIVQINLSITSFKINTLISFWIDMTSICSVSFASPDKGCIKFVPHSCLVYLSHKVGVFLEEAICYFIYAIFAVMLLL